MRSCYCLNILIESNQDDFLKVNIDTLNLNDEEKSHPFFKQEIRQIENLINITKTHGGLVQSKNVGVWSINRCINCECYTYAVHQEKGPSCVLINSNLLNSEDISGLRTSDIYSKVYKIVVNPNDIGGDGDVGYTSSLKNLEEKPPMNFGNITSFYLEVPSEVNSTINKIREIKREMLANEEIKVADLIVKYKEEQQQQLKKLIDRASEEEESLIRLVLCTNDPKFRTKMNMTEQPWSPVRLNNEANNTTFNMESSPQIRQTPKHQKSSKNHTNSFDTETLFDLDIDEEQKSDDNSADELEENHINNELDKDGGREESGISIPKRRQPKVVVAKSLPMTIPKSRYRSTEDLDDEEILEDNVDIAASIKALARSVHGDAVFGELPKPRFSTLI